MKFEIGYLGLLISSTQFIPQVYKVWKTGDTGSLSTMTLIIYLIGQLIWVMHSFAVNDVIRRIQSAINIICFSYLFYKKFMNGEVLHPINDKDKELHEHI